MCGIVGVLNTEKGKPVDQAIVSAMTSAVLHRGPDDEGYYFDGRVGFGHRRLSIIDLASGHQPMLTPEGDLAITFNGEIYNYRELREELRARGCSFATKSDTEVVLNFYREYGEKAFYRLNGIFAFGIYDKKAGRLIIARDHFGIKPLYYYRGNGSFLFASEIKSLLRHPACKKELDLDAFNSFLTFRYNPSPQTLFKGIRKLQPGEFMVVSEDGSEFPDSYWNYRPKTREGITEAEAVSSYQELLEKAIERQMVSDVPVGLLLSGGIDSAVVGYLMRQHSPERIKTFTVGFHGKGDFNELEDAAATARLLGSEHHEITMTLEDYLSFLQTAFSVVEEPIAESGMPSLYFVSKLAASHVKVVLTGQGADEILAGYRRYFGEQQLRRYSALLRTLPGSLLARLLPRNERLKRALSAARSDDEVERFISIYTLFSPDMKRSLLKEEFLVDTAAQDHAIVGRWHDDASGLDDSLARMLFVDTRLSLSDDLLLFGDKVTMANSLEMRVPFLDAELVSFLESLPSDLKLKHLTHKYLHKKAIKKWLPEDIISRKKRGFDTPVDRWLQGQLGDYLREIVNEPSSLSNIYLNIPFIERLIVLHREGRENYKRLLYALLCLELWHRSFFRA